MHGAVRTLPCTIGRIPGPAQYKLAHSGLSDGYKWPVGL